MKLFIHQQEKTYVYTHVYNDVLMLMFRHQKKELYT